MINNPILVGLLLVVATLLGLKGWIVLRSGMSQLRRAIALRRSEQTRAIDVRSDDGIVKVEGTVVPAGTTLSSPITDTECVLFEYEVSTYHPGHIRFIVDRDGFWPVRVVGWRDFFEGGWQGTVDRFVGFRRENWKPIEEGADSVPFLLEDDTGRLLVDPSGAERPVSGETIDGESSSSIWKAVPAFDDTRVTPSEPTREKPNDPAASNVDGKTRYRERCIEPGESVLVYGLVERDLSMKVGDRNVVMRQAAGGDRFYITDDEQSTIRRNYSLGVGRALWSLFYLGLCLGLVAVALAVGTP